MADKKPYANKSEGVQLAPSTLGVIQIEVVKPYCGIEKGMTQNVKAADYLTRYMLKNGYWKEV